MFGLFFCTPLSYSGRISTLQKLIVYKRAIIDRPPRATQNALGNVIRGWPRWMFCKAFTKHALCSSWRSEVCSTKSKPFAVIVIEQLHTAVHGSIFLEITKATLTKCHPQFSQCWTQFWNHDLPSSKLLHNSGNHHFQWVNNLFLWPFSIAMFVYQRVGFWWLLHVFATFGPHGVLRRGTENPQYDVTIQVPEGGVLNHCVMTIFGRQCSLIDGFFNPSEIYISQLGWLFPIYGKYKMFQTTNQFSVERQNKTKNPVFNVYGDIRATCLLMNIVV